MTDPMIFFLDVDDILAIHTAGIEAHGGNVGLRDRGLLESAVAQPAATFGGAFLNADLFEMAAAYFVGLIHNHAFVDGNKRIGYAAALTFLDLNGVWIGEPTVDLYDAAIAAAEGTMDKARVAALFRHLTNGGLSDPPK